MRHVLGILFVTGWMCALDPSVVCAQNDGQEALDQATEKKITADSLADLNEVVRLCDQALKKGLDQPNTDYANNLLTGTLLQRAEILTSAIMGRTPPDPRWPELRGLAVKDLERAIKIDPKLGNAHYLIAQLHAMPGGDPDRARKAIDQAVELTKKDKLAQAKALTLRANLTPFDTAPATDEEKKAAAKSAEKRLADYAAAIELAPDNDEAVRSRGLFYLFQGKFDEALRDFDAAIHIDEDEWSSHFYRGRTLLGLKKLEEAQKSLSKAIELNPNASLAYIDRARAKAVQKEYSAAIEDLDKALELDEESPDARLLRARVYQQNGDAKAAREDLDALLKSRPNLVPALELRAVLAAGDRDFKQSIADFEELLKLSPDNSEVLAQIGILYQVSKKPAAAIGKFTAALEHDGKNFPALRGRADSYLSIGKQAEAIADYEKALKVEPKDSGVLNNLAWVLATSPEEKLRDGKRAIELATLACDVTKYKAAHILSTLAAGYAETGQWDEAVKWSKKAVELGEDESIKDQLKKELASYEQKKPWRERQDIHEADEADAAVPKDDTKSVLKKDEESK